MNRGLSDRAAAEPAAFLGGSLPRLKGAQCSRRICLNAGIQLEPGIIGTGFGLGDLSADLQSCDMRVPSRLQTELSDLYTGLGMSTCARHTSICSVTPKPVVMCQNN